MITSKMPVTFITSTFPTATIQQKNAIFSWKEAGIPFILAGESDITGAQLVLKGVKTEQDLGFTGNSPLINDMIQKASLFVRTDMIALVNADIIIEPDFLITLNKIIEKNGKDIFLTSVRRDLEYNTPINTREDLQKIFLLPWTPHQDGSADLFMTSVDLFKKFAEETGNFIYGRLAWDNWIHLYFHSKGIPCYNTSEKLILWHPKHDYKHLNVDTFAMLYKTPAVNHNMHMFGVSLNSIKKGTGDIIRVKSVFKEPAL